MKLSLLFKISGAILVVNGISMLATPGMAIEMYGMEQTADLVVAMGALGLSFLGTGILIFMLPSWIGDKLASAGILMGLIQLSLVALMFQARTKMLMVQYF